MTTRQDGVVDVVVKGSARPAGVEVREGKRVVGHDRLTERDRGSVLVRLDRLGKGRHALRAYYLGSSTLERSTSKPFTLTVTKPRH